MKPGVCESCKEMDKVIERLREEIRVKEEELNRAIAARGGGLAIGVASGGLRRGGEEKAVALRGREKGHGSGLGSNGSGGSGGSSRQSSVGKADAVPVEMKKLAHDVVEIASSWLVIMKEWIWLDADECLQVERARKLPNFSELVPS